MMEMRARMEAERAQAAMMEAQMRAKACLLYTSDAADERSSVDLGGRRIIKKKKRNSSSIHVTDTANENDDLDLD